MRGNGARNPILALLDGELLKDCPGNDNLIGERGEKVEPGDAAEQNQGGAVDGKAPTHPPAPP